MTNTDTADVQSTVQQVAQLARAGSEMVRVTVNNDAAAKAVPAIFEELAKQNIHVPIIGDFHYNGNLLLTKYPECAQALAKYRINPGTVRVGRKNDDNFRAMVEVWIAGPATSHPHDGRKRPQRESKRCARCHHGRDGRERIACSRTGGRVWAAA